MVSVSLENVIDQDRCACSVKLSWWKRGGGGVLTVAAKDVGGAFMSVMEKFFSDWQPCML